MRPATSSQIAKLIRELREQAELTQAQLAERVGTTQSVISRLENDDYEGHSLSMLYRIGRALDRRVTVTLSPTHATASGVGETAPVYGTTAAAASAAAKAALSEDLFERLAERLAERFHAQGVTKSDVEDAIRWVRATPASYAFLERRGSIKVGPDNAVDAVREARRLRGTGSAPAGKR